MAIRYASALGLNLRNDNRNVVDSSKEIRYRVWWALCSVERILAVMLGRLISFSQTDCKALLGFIISFLALASENRKLPSAHFMLQKCFLNLEALMKEAMLTPEFVRYGADARSAGRRGPLQ